MLRIELSEVCRLRLLDESDADELYELIDANRPQEKIAAEIWRHVRLRLHPETAPMSLEVFAR